MKYFIKILSSKISLFIISYKIFIIKGFWTIVFIFIVISTTFRPICPLAFFRSNLKLSTSGRHIGWNVVEITIKMKTIVWKLLMIKIIKLCFRNLDNSVIRCYVWIFEMRLDVQYFVCDFSDCCPHCFCC